VVTELRSSPFGDLLRQYRIDAGLTQEELAERAGLSTRAISDLERGARRTPQKDTMSLLAQALGLSPRQQEVFVAVARGRSAPVATPAQPHRLPAALTRLVDRAVEVAAVKRLLGRSDRRLVTLRGPGGVGKTRLALHVARQVSERYEDGVALVDLAPIREPDLVINAIATALGLREAGDSFLLTGVTNYLSAKNLLLVLDNFEQVVTAAPQVVALLLACPNLQVLVTSREALHVSGEHVFEVMPLALPDPAQEAAAEQVAECAAVELFLERAQAVKPSFALTPENAATVAAICRQVDGLPLGLELAATWVTLWSPRALLARLESRLAFPVAGPRDAPPRQQTLRTTIVWSHDLLSEAEQALFRRLGVFVGGFAVEAVEATCNLSDPHAVPLLDRLLALVDKSLVQQITRPDGEVRFRLLEAVRDYALECLAASGEERALRQRHAAFYLEMAREAEPRLLGPVELQWLASLKHEHDNLRAALQWAANSADVALGLQLAGLLWRFWWAAGYLSEGRQWLEIVLQWDAGPAPSHDRLRALQGAGVLACYQGDFKVGIVLLEDCLSLARMLDDPGLVADALVMLANTIQWRGEQQRATVLLEEALALYRALDDRRGIPDALVNLGIATLLCGDYHHAADLFGEALQLYHELGNAIGSSLTLTGLGEASRAVGDLEQARNYYGESLALERALGNKPAIISQTANLALVACMTGDVDGAEAYGLKALADAHDLGDRWQTAYCLEALATVACTRGDAARAARLFGSAAALRERIGTPLPVYDHETHYDRALATVHDTLGEHAFAEAWAVGFYVPHDQIVAEILRG
jgi:predicted ATPase/DNA-binding XRE family transcriptional regulator